MNTRNWILFFTFILTFGLSGNAQDTRKSIFRIQGWYDLMAEYNASEKDQLFLKVNTRFSENENTFTQDGLFKSFYAHQYSLGYKRHFDEQWSGGFYERLHIRPNTKEWHTRLFLNHIGKIGEFNFGKDLSVDYWSRPESSNPFLVVYDLARLSFTMNLFRTFEVGGRELTGILSYRVFWLSNLGQEENFYADRFIDKSRLQLELRYRLSEKFSLETFIMHQTDYFLVTATSTPEKLNQLFPVYGIKGRFIFGNTDVETHCFMH